MALANGPQGYGSLTKFLHWFTVFALIAQFAVGWLVEDDAYSSDKRADEIEDAREDAAEDGSAVVVDSGGDAGGGLVEFGEGGGLLWVHLVLGSLILLLGIARLAWRRVGSLPPWAEGLSEVEKKVAHRTEQVLMLMLFVIPPTGFVLILTGDDDWVALHVASHIVFYIALAVHLGLVIKHTAVRRERLLSRML